MPKKIILLISVLLWMFVIFSFSSENGSISKARSTNVINAISSITSSNTEDSTTQPNSNSTASSVTNTEDKDKIKQLIVRKAGHIGEYIILAVLIYAFLRQFNLKKSKLCLLTIVICLLYACTDEFHQLFTPGRDGRVLDVLIDGVGIGIGLLIAVAFRRFRR